jgi:hypothetical protein
MSAYMVADNTINTIINWLDRELEKAYGTIIIRQKLMELGIDPVIPGLAERLGHAMFHLNITGVDARSGDGEARKFRSLTIATNKLRQFR